MRQRKYKPWIDTVVRMRQHIAKINEFIHKMNATRKNNMILTQSSQGFADHHVLPFNNCAQLPILDKLFLCDIAHDFRNARRRRDGVVQDNARLMPHIKSWRRGPMIREDMDFQFHVR